jgi:8-oxo-dGTP pyrophosphatase MutT (NUDIX family)
MPPPEPPPPPEFPQRLARRVLYTCPWLTLYQDEVRLPDGRLLPEYHVVQFQDGVGVLVENDLGELLFEHTYRYATQRLEWAIPAGGIDAGEDPLSAARREVYEETGIETSAHRLLYSYHPNNGASSQTFFLAHCKAGAQTGAMDHGEIKAYRWMAPAEAMSMVNSGEMMDGLSLTGILLWQLGLTSASTPTPPPTRTGA